MTGRSPHTEINPTAISPPAANYAHATLTEGASRWLHTSGVVPIATNGSVPSQLIEQTRVIWANISAMLDEVKMSPADIVSVTTYVTPGHDLGPVMALRDDVLRGRLAASTLVIVAELAQPAWLIEISVVAAN